MSETVITYALLDDMEEKASAATPGPWGCGPTPGYMHHGCQPDSGPGRDEPTVTIRSSEHTEEIATAWNYLLPAAANAAHIARADPATVLALVEEVRRLRKKVANLEWVP